MKDIATVMLLTGALLAAGTIAWYIGVDHYEKLKRRANSCSCQFGYDLTDIKAQHTKYMIHERTRCFYKAEWLAPETPEAKQ